MTERFIRIGDDGGNIGRDDEIPGSGATRARSTAMPLLASNLPGWAQAFPLSANIPIVAGLRFANEGWDPMLLARELAAQFAQACDWLALDPGPHPAPGDPAFAQDLQTLASFTSLAADSREAMTYKALDASILPYYARLLGCSAEFRLATWLMLHVCIEVADLVSLRFKKKYRRPRPGEVWTPLNPILPTPRSPSYPNSHALQALTIGKVMNTCVPGAVFAAPLQTLANRIIDSRVQARVNYPSDAACCGKMADEIITALGTVDDFADLAVRVGREFAGAATMPYPQPTQSEA